MKERIKTFAIDLLGVSGAGVLCYGLWLAWHPLGYIAGGAAVVVVAFILGSRS
jgi:hypothetical protein